MTQSRVNGEDDYLVVGVLLSLGVLFAYYLFVFKLVVSNFKKWVEGNSKFNNISYLLIVIEHY